MKMKIDLDNNYYFMILNNNIFPVDVIDIQKIKLINLFKRKKVLLKINFDKIDKKQYKRIIKKLLFIKKLINKNKIQLGSKEGKKIRLGYIINYDENNKTHNDFILAINAALYNTKYERYNYIYDTVCNYLDSCFYGKNLCDFRENRCGEKRKTNISTGCCHHYKNKLLGPLLKNNFIQCEHLKQDYTCGAKCIACKLFTCDYLEKKGIKFRIKDILLLNVYFNPLQKYFIKYMVFTPKEKIIKRLMMLSL